jgi:hypothetical protein
MKRLDRILATLSALVLVVAIPWTAGAQGARRASAGPTAGVALRTSVDASMARQKLAFRGQPDTTIDCVVSTSGRNSNLDCPDLIAPTNEPDVAVDPMNPNNAIASSNDYDSCCDEIYTTRDGGATWSDMDIDHEADLGSGFGSDPVTAFDPVHGTAVHASLNIHVDPTGSFLCNPDVVASVSTDGGLSWDPATGEPVIVYHGSGCEDSGPFVFNDKEWITADTNPSSPHYGRLYVTWSRFFEMDGVYQESPIWEAHSDDGGYTWTAGHEISGSGSFCTYQTAGNPLECDEDQFSVPVVGPDGTVTVGFENEQHDAVWEPHDTFENQYLVVQSHDGGATWSPPVQVADLEDGSADYPINVDGRQTLSGYQVRVNSAGNIAVDPATGHLAIVFADNRNGNHDVQSPETNTNVFMTTSANGTSWSLPVHVTTGLSDQWFPWAEFNPVSGRLSVLYHSRELSNTAVYNTLLSTNDFGSHFNTTRVTTNLSHPRQSLWFRAQIPSCRRCATFHGDYINIAFAPDGSAYMVWTDMRRFLDLGPPGAEGFTENIFFART